MLNLYVSRARPQYAKAADNLLDGSIREGTIVVLGYRTRWVSPAAILREGDDVCLYAETEDEDFELARWGKVLHVAVDSGVLHITVRLGNPCDTLECAEPPAPYFVQ